MVMSVAPPAAHGTHSVTGRVGKASLARVDRDAVAAFHQQHMLNAASVIAVVGDVDPDETAAMLAREFDALTWRETAEVPLVEWTGEALHGDDSREKQQTALALLFPGPSRQDPQRFATQVLSAVASGLGGRFFEQLRDKQSLAYTVSAFPIERQRGGSFAAYIATSPAREDEARTGLLAEFAKLREAPPSEEELERARRYLIGTHQIAQQSGASVLGDLVDAWLFGAGLHEVREFESRIRAVSAADVLAVSAAYFDPARVVEGVVRGTAIQR